MWIAAGAAAPASGLNGREKLVIATGSNPSQEKKLNTYRAISWERIPNVLKLTLKFYKQTLYFSD